MYSPLERGYLTQGFNTGHRALDIGWISYLILSPPVHALMDGIVVQSAFETLGGNVIAIRHDVDGGQYYLSRYVHLASRKVKLGDRVTGNQIIGIGGKTGQDATGKPLAYHLHFEIWICPDSFQFSTVKNVSRDAYAVDPRLLIDTTMKGEGFKMTVYTPTNFPYCTTSRTDLSYRDTPSLKGIEVGHLVKDQKYPILGKSTVPDVNNLTWAQVLINGKIMYVATFYLTINEPTKEIIKEVIKTVYVESPIDATLISSNGITVTLKRAAGVPK